MLRYIPRLMENGKPVCILFTDEKGVESTRLYCELIQKARFGEKFLIKNQGCTVGAFVLGETEISPENYYFGSKRYENRTAAKRAVDAFAKVVKKGKSIKIFPYTGGNFDVLLLFLKPERAMRLIQAFTYAKGLPVMIKTGGIASICSDCTAYPAEGKLGISLGCKGSRKHSKYPDDELVVGIPYKLAEEIEDALEKIPDTFE
jgi:uncharacterized protein (DUF169 family)